MEVRRRERDRGGEREGGGGDGLKESGRHTNYYVPVESDSRETRWYRHG